MELEKVSADLIAIVPVVMRLIRAEMRGLAQPELSIAQFRILARLSVEPHTNKRLAEWMGVSTPTMSRTLSGLVQRGYVTRKSTNDDKREVSLSLTKKGKEKFAGIEERTRLRVAERMKEMSGAKLKQLDAGLLVLAEVFSK